MKTDTIKKRQRYESGPAGTRKVVKRSRQGDDDDMDEIDDSAVPSLDIPIKQEYSQSSQDYGSSSSPQEFNPSPQEFIPSPQQFIPSPRDFSNSSLTMHNNDGISPLDSSNHAFVTYSM
jgi:hypothetical protein